MLIILADKSYEVMGIFLVCYHIIPLSEIRLRSNFFEDTVEVLCLTWQRGGKESQNCRYKIGKGLFHKCRVVRFIVLQ